jgi:beta-barrel assembly-enhancing protease
MHTFEASYYDGQKSIENKAKVWLVGENLVIEYQNQAQEAIKVLWIVDQITKNEFSSNQYTLFQYGSFPYESLQFPPKSYLAQQLNNRIDAKQSKGGQIVGTLRKSGFSGIMFMAMLCVGFLALTYFWIIPTFAVFTVGAIPMSQEIKLGNSIYKSMFEKAEVEDTEVKSKTDSLMSMLEPFNLEQIDQVQTQNLNKFLKQIDFQTDYPLEVTVVNDSMVNAFALPGGHMVVFTGILQKMKKKEELVALLGHEVAHITERHTLKNLAKSISNYLMVTIVTSDVNGIVALLAEQANSINNLKFGRELEKEADLKGLETMEHNHLDKNGMPALMQTLQNEMEKMLKGQEIPSFMSSHPPTKERISYTKTLAKSNNAFKANQKLDAIWSDIQMGLK